MITSSGVEDTVCKCIHTLQHITVTVKCSYHHTNNFKSIHHPSNDTNACKNTQHHHHTNNNECTRHHPSIDTNTCNKSTHHLTNNNKCIYHPSNDNNYPHALTNNLTTTQRSPTYDNNTRHSLHCYTDNPSNHHHHTPTLALSWPWLGRLGPGLDLPWPCSGPCSGPAVGPVVGPAVAQWRGPCLGPALTLPWPSFVSTSHRSRFLLTSSNFWASWLISFLYSIRSSTFWLLRFKVLLHEQHY